MATKLKNPTSATAMAIQAQRTKNAPAPSPSLLRKTATAVGQAVQPIVATAQQAIAPIVNAIVPAPATPPAQTPIVQPTSAVGMAVQAQRDENALKASQQASKAQEVATQPVPTQNTAKVDPNAPAIDYNKSEGRQQDINANLVNITTSNPAIAKDRGTFDKAFGYATADEGKKALLDTFFASKQPLLDGNSIYQNLLQGVAVTDPEVLKSPQYGAAKERFDSVQKVKNYTPEQFSVALSNGSILEGTTQYNDLVSDPVIKEKLLRGKQLNTINGKTVDTTKAGEEATAKIMSDPTIANALADGSFSQAEIASLTTTPEIQKQALELQDLAKKRNELKSTYENIENDIDAQIKGTGTTRTERAQMISNAQRAILPSYNLANDNYNSAYGLYKDAKTDAMDIFKTNVGLYREDKAAKAVVDAEGRKVGQQNAFLALQQSYANPDINSSNEQIALMAAQKVIDTANKIADEYGVSVMTRDTSKALAYSKANGVSIAVALQKTFTEPTNNSPEFKQALENAQAKAGGTKFSMGFDPITGTPYSFNTKTGEINGALWGGMVTSSGTTPTVDSSYIASFTTIRKGSSNVQCGELSNDYWLSVTGKKAGMGDTLNDKYGALSEIGRSEIPEVGGLFVSNPLKNSVGHNGIVQRVNSDGSVTVREANANGSKDGWPAVTRTYTAQQIASQDMKFSIAPVQANTFDPNKAALYQNSLDGKVTIKDALQQGTTLSQIQKEAQAWSKSPKAPSDEVKSYFTKYLNGTASEKELTDGLGTGKEAVALKTELSQLIAAHWPAYRKVTDPVVVDIDKRIESMKWLLEDSRKGIRDSLTGTFQASGAPIASLTKERGSYLARLANVVDTGTLSALIDAKGNGATFGALDASELRLLANTSSKLASSVNKDKDTNKLTGTDLEEGDLDVLLREMLNNYVQQRDRVVGTGIKNEVSKTLNITGSSSDDDILRFLSQ